MRALLPAVLLVGVLAACSDGPTPPVTARPIAAPSLAVGTGAHFLSLGGSLSGANLVITFREGGLGNGPTNTVHVEATADASALYGCINGGSKHPQASNKEAVNGPVSASGDFGITKNGSASGSLTLNPPAATLQCPSGQSLVLANVTYSNVTITDTTNGVTEAVPGSPFTAVLVTFK